jgi:hypothetical protein
MKASPALQLVIPQPSKESILDGYGELDRLVQAFEPTRKRREARRAEILAWYPDSALHPAQDLTLSGIKYDVTITPRDNESQVADMNRLYKTLKRERFLSVVKTTVKALTACMGEAAAQLHLVKVRTGPRHLIAVPKAAPATVAKAA